MAERSPNFTTFSTSPRTSSTRLPRYHLHHTAALLDVPRRGTGGRHRRKSGFEPATADARPKEVTFNSAITIETFDFIVTDECHRLTTRVVRPLPYRTDRHTEQADHRLLQSKPFVTEYNHERAVADSINVGCEVCRMKTQVTEQGWRDRKGLVRRQASQGHPSCPLEAAR